MKHLLMISYPFPPLSIAGAVRSERFARYLPEFDWSVDVVTIKPREDLFVDRKGLLKSMGEYVKVHQTTTIDPGLWLRNKKTSNVFINKIRSIFMELFSFPDHMIFWVPLAVKKGLVICKEKEIDAIYTTSSPHSTHLTGLALSKLMRKPWVADFRDPWTLNAYRGKGLLESFFLKIEKIMEKAVLEKASVILVNTKANRDNLLKAFPRLIPDKIIHLPNGWEEFPTRYSQQEKKNGPFTIVHAGTFYPRFKPYALLYALAAWQDGKQPAEIPSLGRDVQIILLGARDSETKHLVHDLGIEEIVQVKPWVALEDARRIMCQADMLWASLGTGQESSTFIPSKLFEYIASNRPIIGFFAKGEATSLIRETGTGFVFTNDDQISIIKFLYEMMSTKKGTVPGWYNPNLDAINRYNIKKITATLSQVLDEMIEKHKRNIGIKNGAQENPNT